MDITKKIEKFKEKLMYLYPNKYIEIIENLSASIPRSFWINDSNTNEILDSLKNKGFEIKKTSIENVFIASENDNLKLSFSEEFINGKIYIQELSSLLPAIVLDPKENENILDLCASPGSKSLLLNKISRGKSNLYSNELDRKRFFKMKANFEKYNAKNINLLNYDGTKLNLIKPEFNNYFDKILVDAPCSSENTLNFKDTSSFKYWNSKKYKSFVKLQKKLLLSAFSMLRPGGTILYSTCTYSIEENEAIVNDLCNNYPDQLSIVDLSEIIGDHKEYTIERGFDKYNTKIFPTDMQNTFRILPNKLSRTFFLSLVRKNS